MSKTLIENIKNFKKIYLYKKITHYIKNDKNGPKLSKCDKSFGTKMYSDIIEAMKKFSNKYGIRLEFKECDASKPSNICSNFLKIIKWHKQSLNKNERRKEHLIILKNLLFTEKDKKIIANFDLNDGNISENIFDKNDFIYHYSLKAVENIFNDKFTEAESTSLNNIYFHLIFQVNAPEFVKILKILTYNYLSKNKFNAFIDKSLEYINKSLDDICKIEEKSDLEQFKKDYDELDNIDIKENVPENVKLFFLGEAKKFDNTYKLLNIFTRKNIESNYEKIESQEISKNDIIIDSLKFDKNKLNLFSPEFLIANGLKSKIESCDIEIFNSNNYYVDIFAEFINEIIEKINYSIDNNNFSDEFIQKNLIKFNKMESLHYICAKLEYEHIKEIRNSMQNSLIEKKGKKEEKEKVKNDFINIKINNKINKDKSNNIINDLINDNKNESSKENKKNKDKSNNEIKDSEDNNKIVNEIKSEKEVKKFDEDKETDNNTSNKNNVSESLVISILSKSLLSDFNKKLSEFFEGLIYKKVIKNIDNGELIVLPNIIYMLNLKIPMINKDNDTLEFKSIHLDSFNSDKKYANNNYYYGCKEIDVIFRNKSEKSHEISESHLFTTNFTFIRKEKEDKFFLEENKNFSIDKNSLMFFEIKKSFPNRSSGNENILTVEVKPQIQTKNPSKSSMGEENPLYAYNEQLIKLLKKFRYFFNIFESQINKKKELNIHIALIYDTVDVNENEKLFEGAKKLTDEVLNYYGWRINNLGTTIFQLVFFNELEYNKTSDEKLNEKDKIISEKDSQINKIISEKDSQINKILTEKDSQINEINKIVSQQNSQFEEIKKLYNDPNLTVKERDKKIKDIINKN